MDVRPERSGWRDEHLSQRHRLWGYDCPAVDIDFLVIEFNQGKVAALVEYKNEFAKPQFASHPSYQALIDLGNRASVPFFAVRYASNFAWFRVTGLNEFAKPYKMKRTEMSEIKFVQFLYTLRGLEVPYRVKMELSKKDKS